MATTELDIDQLYPLHPTLVGELIECIDCLERVERAAKEHITYLNSLLEHQINRLFHDKAVLSDRTSIWYGFSNEDIRTRRSFFSDILVPKTSRQLARFRWWEETFVYTWRTDPSYVFSDTARAIVEVVDTVWHNIEEAMSTNKRDLAEPGCNDGPYNLDTPARCQSLLDQLDRQIIDLVGSRNFNADRSDYGQFLWMSHVKDIPGWTIKPLDMLRKSKSLAKAPQKHDHDPDLDLEKGLRIVEVSGSWLWRIRKRTLFVVSLSFLIAIVYSIVTHDAQTGFGIAAAVLAAAGLVHWLRKKPQKITLD